MFHKNLAGVLLAALLAAGCVQKDKPPVTPPTQTAATVAPRKPPFYLQWMGKLASVFPKKKNPPAANPPRWAGTIRMVNAAEKFVLIESNTLSAIVPGETYTVIGGGAETASLRMTDLRESPFLIADIVSGSPTEGDKIYIPRVDAAPMPPPAPKPTKKNRATPAAKPKPEPTPAPVPSQQGAASPTLPAKPEKKASPSVPPQTFR